MSEFTPIKAATQDCTKEVFNDFNRHAGSKRTETKQRVLDSIREWYPKSHVTAVSQRSCSLLEYAAAGKATVEAVATEDSIATRQWKAVGSGVEKKKHPGKLDDEYSFAKFSYEWESTSFTVYYLEYTDPMKATTRTFYIIHPRSSTDSNIHSGHCTETDALILAAGKWTSELHEEIWVFDNGYWDKSKELWSAVQGSSWADVILDPEMKDHLIHDVQGFFDNRDLYAQYAVPWKRGIILHGVPGNGKTISIKALINSLYNRPDNISSLYVKSLNTSCNTEQYAIRQIFLQARRCAPCLLIFEDLDSLVCDNARSYFLNEVDGLESNDGILMIGSTNHLDKLDPAIAKRPSRFDRKYHFKLPSANERELYAQYWREKLLRRNDGVEFPEELCPLIAELTEGFSFAYLKELFVMALLALVRGFKGDDFEIVDKEEADSAPEDEPAADGTDAAGDELKDAKEQDVCTCAAKCSTCGKPVPDPVTAATAATAAMTAATTASGAPAAAPPHPFKIKNSLASVSIPEQLKDNLLLRVLRHQIRVLVSEMDNTKVEEWRGGKKEMQVTAGTGARSRAQQIQAQMRVRRSMQATQIARME